MPLNKNVRIRYRPRKFRTQFVNPRHEPSRVLDNHYWVCIAILHTLCVTFPTVRISKYFILVGFVWVSIFGRLEMVQDEEVDKLLLAASQDYSRLHALAEGSTGHSAGQKENAITGSIWQALCHYRRIRNRAVRTCFCWQHLEFLYQAKTLKC